MDALYQLSYRGIGARWCCVLVLGQKSLPKLTNFSIFAAVEASYFWRRVFLLVVDSGFGRFGATNASNSAQAIPFTK